MKTSRAAPPACAQEPFGEERRDLSSLALPQASPWRVLCAYLAAHGEDRKLQDVIAYLRLLQTPETERGPVDKLNFDILDREITQLYRVESDLLDLLDPNPNPNPNPNPEPGAGSGPGDAAEPDLAEPDLAERDLAERVRALRAYLAPFDQGDAAMNRALQSAMERTAMACERMIHEARALSTDAAAHRDDEDFHFWRHPATSAERQEIEPTLKEFPVMLQRSLDATMKRLQAASSFAQSIAYSDDDVARRRRAQYGRSMRAVSAFLRGEKRADLNFVDLLGAIPEHRGGHAYAGSATAYQLGFDALIMGLAHRMPSEERQRESLQVAHTAIDPYFIDLCYGLKLSYLNAKFDLRLSPHDIDALGVSVGMISPIMRGFEISGMDDRAKRALHNSGDHSLRVIAVVASLRDRHLERLGHMKLPASILGAQRAFEFEAATYLARLACEHDTGELLGELLGNNLVGRSEEETSVLKALRDNVEDHVQARIVPKELRIRLSRGPWRNRWPHDRLSRLHEHRADHVSKGSDRFDFGAPVDGRDSFHMAAFHLLERLQTTIDLTAQRIVGAINDQGRWETGQTMTADQARYTMQYCHSKISGHQFQSTDPADIAAYHRRRDARDRFVQNHRLENRTAREIGAAVPHALGDRFVDHPITRLPLDVYMDEKDVNFEKSIFYSFYRQIDHNFKTMTVRRAQIFQVHAESLLQSLCDEVARRNKRFALLVGVDGDRVYRATRKSAVQGLALAQAGLKGAGACQPTLQMLRTPREALARDRYRVLSADKSRTRWFARPEIPHQLFEPFQFLFRVLYDLLAKGVGAAFLALFRVLITPSQMFLQLNNKHVAERDFLRLFEVASALELAGDASLTATGLAESGGIGSPADVDTKTLAALNPLLTFAVARPMREAEAIKKCYGHILARYGDQIAGKYFADPPPGAGRPNLRRAIDYLKTQSNLRHGRFQRRAGDIMLSGKLAEEMHAYFETQYDPRRSVDPALRKTRRFRAQARQFERAEIFMLREMMVREIAKADERLAQDFDVVEQNFLKDRLAILGGAYRALGRRYGWGFGNLARQFGVELRFGAIMILGALFMFSGSGVTLLDETMVGPLSTSTLFGLNLAIAGGACLAASLRARMARLPYNSPFRRRLEGLPRFERDENGGLYILRGFEPTLPAAGFEHFRHAERHLFASRRPNGPPLLRQLRDIAVASIVTPLRALGCWGVSKRAFANQTAAQAVDSAGVFAAVATSAANPAIGATKLIGTTIAQLCFSRVTVLNMYMIKIRETLERGGAPNYEIIKRQIDLELRAGGDPDLIDFLQGIKAAARGRVWRRLGGALEAMVCNNMVSRASGRFFEWTLGVETRPAEAARPTAS